MNIPNIKLGKIAPKRSEFDLTHDVNTTSDFGFCQPLMVRPLIPKSTFEVSVDSFVRTSPLVVPTFGRINVKQYHRFVPTSELYKPFENLLSGQQYDGSGSNYVPSTVPTATLSQLSRIMLSYCKATVYVTTGATTTTDYVTGMTLASASQLTRVQSIMGTSTGNTSYISAQWKALKELALNNYAASNKDHVTLDGADFIFNMNDTATATTRYTFCVKATTSAKNIRKILLGAGYQIDLFDDTSVSLLPIFAYYKAYFDTMYPKRFISWTNTNCYKIIQMMSESNSAFNTLITNATNVAYVKGFFDDLSKCYATFDMDFLGAHVATPSVEPIASTLKYVAPGSDAAGTTTELSLTSSSYSLPSQTTVNASNPIDAVRLKLLNTLYKTINKHTAIGAKIADYMKLHFNADLEINHDSSYIGSSVFNVNVGDVMNTTDAGSMPLGDYAGKAIGSDNSQTFKFTTDCHGYWVTLMCIVPQSNYNQGLDPTLLARTRYEQYQGEFDGLGMEVTPKSCVITNGDVAGLSSQMNTKKAFGYSPRYTSFKIANNVLSGDMSRRGTRDSLAAYTLDKTITRSDVRFEELDGNTYKEVYFENPEINSIVAGTPWRFCGLYNWLSNYNRIFYNTDEPNVAIDSVSDVSSDDNFLVHNIINAKMYAPMLSISESFDTDASDDNSMSVNKA